MSCIPYTSTHYLPADPGFLFVCPVPRNYIWQSHIDNNNVQNCLNKATTPATAQEDQTLHLAPFERLHAKLVASPSPFIACKPRDQMHKLQNRHRPSIYFQHTVFIEDRRALLDNCAFRAACRWILWCLALGHTFSLQQYFHLKNRC